MTGAGQVQVIGVHK